MPLLVDSKKICILLVIVAFGIILYFFDPENIIWFPKCPFWVLTGYQCPACGVQRAAYHLLHLDFKKAFLYNPFLIISIPYALALIKVTWFSPKNRNTKLRAFCYHPVVVRTYVVIFIAWWIVRNL